MSDSKATRFIYRPLSHSSKDVRLLLLLSSKNFGDPVVCELKHSSLEEAPQYEALSYVWGETNASEPIQLHGQEVTVRQNLLDALRHLRCDRERTLWVDAICIDQENVLERNHQVGQMGFIYGFASRVISWLGPASSDSEFAIDFLTDLSSADTAPDGTQDPTKLLACTKKRRKAVQRLIEREYWKRVWIVQEVVLARDIFIMCGNAGIYWDNFISGMKRSIGESIAAHLDGQKSRRRTGHGVRLYDILVACKDSLCTDPRDKVFAFLGIADDCQNGELEADYSISTWDLYEQLVGFLWRARTRAGITDIRFFAHTILEAPIPPLRRFLPSVRLPDWLSTYNCYDIGIIHRVGNKTQFRPTDDSSQPLSELSVSVLEHPKTETTAEKQVELKTTRANMFPVLYHGYETTVSFTSSKRSTAILYPASSYRQIGDPVDGFRPIFYGAGRIGFSFQNVGVGDLVFCKTRNLNYSQSTNFGFIVRPIPHKSKKGRIISPARFISPDL